VRASLTALLDAGTVLLADGATATNYFAAGLAPDAAPEGWNLEHPDRVRALHRAFVAAGADVILTNTFGCNRTRLGLHGLHEHAYEIARHAAEIARAAADEASGSVVVAGSVGPTGVRLEPHGPLAHADAVASFHEQIAGLRDGGADVAWIETMAAADEVRLAAQAAIDVGLPYVVTCSFGAGGRTLAGMAPDALVDVCVGLTAQPLAIGANCGVGPAEVLASARAMAARLDCGPVVAKANCGLPRLVGGQARYGVTPRQMAEYAQQGVDAGARIVGGCCGTTPGHIAAMRAALDRLARE
jgi:methionine synthase I (cobalamin-dependent)